MKRNLMGILCCPICKGDVKLSVSKETPKEVLEGALHCDHCSVDYPIEDGIPNMLPPGNR